MEFLWFLTTRNSLLFLWMFAFGHRNITSYTIEETNKDLSSEVGEGDMPACTGVNNITNLSDDNEYKIVRRSLKDENGKDTSMRYLNKQKDMELCMHSRYGNYVFMAEQGQRDKLMYVIQTKENQSQHVISMVSRFGFHYLETIISDVHLFVYCGNNSESDAYAIQVLFGDKISSFEVYDRAKINFHCPKDPTYPLACKHSNQVFRNCSPYFDTGTEMAQELGYTGKNIVVAVVDTGVEMDHTALKANIDMELSYNFVGGNKDINPQRFHNYRRYEELTGHGTLAAGVIGGQRNDSYCSKGVAPNVTLAVLKVFEISGPMKNIDFDETPVPTALEYKRDSIDIYSCSFNHPVMFRALSLPMKIVLREGTKQGRHGKGNIFVFPSGNQNEEKNLWDCNGSGYSSSIYTITISSVGVFGKKPYYAIPCACVIASTFGDTRGFNNIALMSTTLRDKYDNFNSTSAATAKASAIFALVLEANPELTWREVQYLAIYTSSLDNLEDTKESQTNSFGLTHDPYFGFGLLNATAMILLGRKWQTVPTQIVTNITMSKLSTTPLEFVFPPRRPGYYCISYLEHVVVNITYSYHKNCHPTLRLCSSPTFCSSFLRGQPQSMCEAFDKNQSLITRSWQAMTVAFWGEDPARMWSIQVEGNQTAVHDFTVSFYGTSYSPIPRNLNNMYFHDVHQRRPKKSKCDSSRKIKPTPPYKKTDKHSDSSFSKSLSLHIVKKELIVLLLLVTITM